MPAEAEKGRARLALDAAVWGLPLVMFGRYLDAAVAAGVPFNRFLLNADIATPGVRSIGPNIDTLNGFAWLDLSAGPQILGVPDTADRYYTVQLQDMYMNTFAYVGRRTTGTRSGAFAITQPGFSGPLPAGVQEIRAPTTKVLAFLRTLVRDPGDVAAVRAINQSFGLGTLAEYPGGLHHSKVSVGALDAFQPAGRAAGKSLPYQDIAKSGVAYFDELNALVRAFPPSASDAVHLARFGSLGLGSANPVARDPGLAADLAAAVPAAVDLAQKALVTRSDNGWARRPNVAQFIADPVQHAANILYGPGTQVAEESVFWNMRVGPDGHKLNGATGYRMHFAPGRLPPVGAFWSLTLYDGAYVLFDNPLDRYGITDRNAVFEHTADGALEIRISADAPTASDVNWLPAPRGEFQLVFRSYQPRAAILDGSYLLPPLEMTGAA